MSTIKANTLQNVAASKSAPVGDVVDGYAKAWVNFNGTGTPAIRAAFNVSSITDNGVGDYTVNFTNAFADANYAMTGAARKNLMLNHNDVIAPTTTSARIFTQSDTSASSDSEYVGVAFFR